MPVKNKFVAMRVMLILLIILYVVLSCFELNEIVSSEINKKLSFQMNLSNLSLALLISAVVYVLFLIVDHSILQIISGIITLLPGMRLPLEVHLTNLMEKATSHVGEHYTQWRLTTAGIVQTVLSWSLLLLIIVYAVMNKKKQKENTAMAAFEGDETIK